jgi:chitodextrinase
MVALAVGILDAEHAAKSFRCAMSDSAKDAITLMTLHSAKGLEFKTVFSDGPIGSTHPWCMILEHIGNVKVYNNVCNAGGAGFYDGTNVTFKNNIYINGGYNPYGISASGWGNGVMDASGNNLLYESGRTYSGFAGDVLNKDPKFVNLASYNFHLQSGSPAIDAAANVSVLTDLDGNSRPQGAGYDIGAYEYASGGSNPPPDTTAPTVPTNLSASAVSSSAINLSWSASTDAVGVTGYRIYRAGTQIGTSVSTTYSDSGLSASTSYSYTVAAYDAAGNTSAQSSSASATTQAPPLTPDVTAPTVSITSPLAGTVSGNITFSATASDPSVAGQTLSGLKTLTLYIDGSTYATSSSGSISKTLDTTTLTNASHTLTAQAIDNAGNNSTIASVTITVNNAPATKYPRTITLTSLEGLSAIPNNQSITVTILSGSTVLETQNLTPNASKQYTVTFLSSDPQLVDIRVKVNNYLSAKLSAIDTTINSPSSLTVNPLLAGDINNDNTINSLDYSSLNSNWLKTTSTGDLNNDGIVNSFDFAILKNNWGKAGQ